MGAPTQQTEEEIMGQCGITIRATFFKHTHYLHTQWAASFACKCPPLLPRCAHTSEIAGGPVGDSAVAVAVVVVVGSADARTICPWKGAKD